MRLACRHGYAQVHERVERDGFLSRKKKKFIKKKLLKTDLVASQTGHDRAVLTLEEVDDD